MPRIPTEIIEKIQTGCMMTRETITILPPSIKQIFSTNMLSSPYPKFGDGVHTLEKMIQECKKLFYKFRNNPRKKERCENLMQEIISLYERAKIKEEERSTEKDHKTQGFGYFVTIPEKMDREIYRRLAF